jgi:hypothetical protein
LRRIAWQYKFRNSLSEKYTGNLIYQGWGNSNTDHMMYVIETDKVNGR